MTTLKDKFIHFISRYAVAIALLSGIGMAWCLRHTPFRAEHWGLLHQMETAPTLVEQIKRVAMFVCYSVGRYQPLAFFPTAMSYWVFGLSYFWHYLVAVLLHFAVSLQFAALFAHFIGERETSMRGLLQRRSLEVLWFFSLFVAADVMAWTFYIYVELAVLCALTALLKFWEGRTGLSVLLLVLSTLLYEPFLVLCSVVTLHLAVRSAMAKKWRVDFLFLLGFQILMVWVYSGTYQSRETSLDQVLGGLLGKTLYTRHDALIGVPWASVKPFFVFYNWCLMSLLALKSFLLPTFAVKLNIYEMAVPESFRNGRFFYYAWVFFALALFGILRLSKKIPLKRLWTVGFVSVAMFGIIAWGRNEDGIFPAVQIRYHYILTPFIGLLFLSLLRFSVKLYPVLVTMLILINLGSSWDHFLRVRHDMQDVSTYLDIPKNSKVSNLQRIQKMVDGMLDIQIPYREENLFFTYNARGALSKR